MHNWLGLQEHVIEHVIAQAWHKFDETILECL